MLAPLRGLIRKTRVMAAAVSGACSRAEISDEQPTDKHTYTDAGDRSYEAAIKALHLLQSNAEDLAKARLRNRDDRRNEALPNMLKYVERSGLTMEEIDKLSVIHVSGTKGKGSTCAFCERIFHCHGYKTGLSTSPHLVQVCERIRIGGQPISEQLFAHYFWFVYNNLKQAQSPTGPGAGNQDMPAYFAFLTILALHVFVKEKVDVVIMEVGIGGRFDSTNILRSPDVCGVTSLGLDHTALLGNTIEEIAWNKAGIFKPGRPAITVSQPDAALQVIVNSAKETQNPIYLSKPMSSEVMEKLGVKLGIAARKQVLNASLAIQLYRMWKLMQSGGVAASTDQKISSPAEIPQLEVNDLDQETLTALASCRWPGRSQTIRREGVTYFLDGAHTKESIDVCVEWFKEASEKERAMCGGQVARVLLFMCTGDRGAEAFLRTLKTCEFDAAAFCTSLVSTDDSLNRIDQARRSVSVAGMVNRAEQDKSVWNRLFLEDAMTDVSTSCDASNGQMSHSKDTCHSDMSNQISDHNANLTQHDRIHHSLDKEVRGSQDSAPCKKLKLSVNHDQQEISKPACNADGQSREVLYASTNGHSSVGPDYESEQTQLTGNVQEQRDFSNNCGQHQPLQNGQSCASPVSAVFPSILQALAWSSQGRDSSIKLSDPDLHPSDPNACIEKLPAAVKEAAQIHILVTGSLHLVGGVLGVIDPSLKE